jgi:hypothetical protein
MGIDSSQQSKQERSIKVTTFLLIKKIKVTTFLMQIDDLLGEGFLVSICKLLLLGFEDSVS